MLVIRLQRTGRSGHAMFRIVAQDSRRSPKSGKVVALLGNYDPHSKKVNLDKETTVKYLTNGAQPSDRIIRLLKAEAVKLPKWAEPSPAKKKAVRNPEKRRSTAPEPTEKPVVEESVVETAADQEQPTPEVAPVTTSEPELANDQEEQPEKLETDQKGHRPMHQLTSQLPRKLLTKASRFGI